MCRSPRRHMELYLISKFTRKPTNTANFSTTTPTSSTHSLRCCSHGGPQEERSLRSGNRIPIRREYTRGRPRSRSPPTSSTWLWSSSALIRCTITCLWRSLSWIWRPRPRLRSASPGLWTAYASRSECSQPAVRADEHRPGTSSPSSSAARRSYSAEPTVPLGPHRAALPRLGTIQPSSSDQPALQRRSHPLRVRERVE